jgi:hypothetical protein
MTNVTHYLEEGQVQKKWKIHTISRFLTSHARDFYISTVAYSHQDWELDGFFKALFTWCFPADYISKFRGKISSLERGKWSVRAYTAKLSELYLLVGADTSNSDRVDKLWTSLRPNIQRELWMDGLRPETATWDELFMCAEKFEIAEKAANRVVKNPRHKTE